MKHAPDYGIKHDEANDARQRYPIPANDNLPANAIATPNSESEKAKVAHKFKPAKKNTWRKK